MTLREFLLERSRADKEVFWARLGRTKRGDRVYIYSFNGRRRPSPELARAIHAASDGLITLAELRPDIWGETPAVASRKRANGKSTTQKVRRAV